MASMASTHTSSASRSGYARWLIGLAKGPHTFWAPHCDVTETNPVKELFLWFVPKRWFPIKVTLSVSPGAPSAIQGALWTRLRKGRYDCWTNSSVGWSTALVCCPHSEFLRATRTPFLLAALRARRSEALPSTTESTGSSNWYEMLIHREDPRGGPC